MVHIIYALKTVSKTKLKSHMLYSGINLYFYRSENKKVASLSIKNNKFINLIIDVV